MVYYPNLLNNKSVQNKEPAKPRIKGKIKKIFFLAIIVVLSASGYFLYKTNYLIKKISGENGSILQNVSHLVLGANDELKGEKEGRINVLLLGMRGADDPHGGLLTDSIIIASVKLSELECGDEDLLCWRTRKEMTPEKVALISIPRDLFVEIPGYNGLQKINQAHFFGEKRNKEGGGLKLMEQTVSEVTGLAIDYGISVDFEGFKEIIEQLGGVEIDVARDFYDPNYDGGIYVKAGRQTMDAETALKYAQARLTSNDFDRARRQQAILVGIKDKAMSKDILSNPIKMLSILDSLGKHLKTNMQIWEMKRFMELSKDMNDESKTIHKVFDTSPEGLLYSANINGAYALRPVGDNFDKIKETVASIFNL